MIDEDDINFIATGDNDGEWSENKREENNNSFNIVLLFLGFFFSFLWLDK